MHYPFKKSKIIRTCEEHYTSYDAYRPHLQKDFNHRCAYCDLNDEWLKPLSFNIDHFIPRKAFVEAGRLDLDTEYKNLMYSCPSCNKMKSSKFEGEINENQIDNPLFYNPETKDLNQIFYRDHKGRIHSDDPKGKEIIKTLGLYRSSKQIGWYLDELQDVLNGIIEVEIRETDSRRKCMLLEVSMIIKNEMFDVLREFVNSYARGN